MSKSSPVRTPQLRNRKAAMRFEVLEKVECGLVLVGAEVKSLRQGRASLEESFARIRNGEVWLHGLHIQPYEHAPAGAHDPIRPRKLLLHAREIAKLRPKIEQKGLTLVPLDLYFSQRGLAKVTLALVRGKSHRDKRQDLKRRDDQREMQRALRRRR